MIQTGTATVPAALGEERPAAFGTGLSGRSYPGRRPCVTLPRPGEQRKDACLAATVSAALMGFKASRSHLFTSRDATSLRPCGPMETTAPDRRETAFPMMEIPL